KADALERRGDVDIERGLPNALEQAFDERVDVLAVDETHLDVHLRELRLPVRAQILVTIATRELEITLHATHHENLFELLRRLRQRIERSRLATIRHQKFARTFRRGLEQRRRLDFEEALLIHVTARGNGHLRTQAQIARHLRPAQIEI